MKKNTSVKSILTDPSITDEQVHEWVEDLFESFKDENGEIHIHTGVITADRIYI